MPSPNTKLGGLTTFTNQMKPLENWTKAVADRINQVTPYPSVAESNVTQIPGVGTTQISDPLLFDPAQVKLAVIQSSGPGGASNYTDNRYWWKEGMVVQNNTTSTAVSSPATVIVNPGTWNATAQTFTNLNESVSSHSLTTGSVVQVHQVVGVPGTVNGFSYAQWVALPGMGGSSTFTSPLTTKGDIYTRNATVDTRLAVGANGMVLTAASGHATGLTWAPGLPENLSAPGNVPSLLGYPSEGSGVPTYQFRDQGHTALDASGEIVIDRSTCSMSLNTIVLAMGAQSGFPSVANYATGIIVMKSNLGGTITLMSLNGTLDNSKHIMYLILGANTTIS